MEAEAWESARASLLVRELFRVAGEGQVLRVAPWRMRVGSRGPAALLCEPAWSPRMKIYGQKRRAWLSILPCRVY